jgi:hypothetical protein
MLVAYGGRSRHPASRGTRTPLYVVLPLATMDRMPGCREAQGCARASTRASLYIASPDAPEQARAVIGIGPGTKCPSGSSRQFSIFIAHFNRMSRGASPAGAISGLARPPRQSAAPAVSADTPDRVSLQSRRLSPAGTAGPHARRVRPPRSARCRTAGAVANPP